VHSHQENTPVSRYYRKLLQYNTTGKSGQTHANVEFRMSIYGNRIFSAVPARNLKHYPRHFRITNWQYTQGEDPGKYMMFST
jgi:hypothetical protein